MRLGLLLLLSASVILWKTTVTNGGSDPSPATQPATQRQFGLTTRPAADTIEIGAGPWYVLVESDGSAHVQCGAREVYKCKQGSIDYQAALKQLTKNTVERPKAMSLDETGVVISSKDGSRQTLMLKDKNDAADVFEQIRQVFKKDANKPSNNLEAAWTMSPPTPNSKKWDEP